MSARSTQNVRVLPATERISSARASPPGTASAPVMTPGFFEPSSGTFAGDPYLWMKDVLGIPKAERDAVYAEHFGQLPE